MRARVLFYVLHLQGIGHVVRASRIASYLAANGFAVTLIMGGMPLEAFQPSNVDIVQLPPLRMAKHSYRDLLKADGSPIDEAYKAQRFVQLRAALARSSPDIVMIEAYPFDRPQMHFELVPFLDMVQGLSPRPVIISSVRDILQKKDKPERDDTALERLQTYFDRVLVHGDPRLATLAETFRHADKIADMVHYTGIVAPPPFTPLQKPVYDVVVTAGGGTTAKAILAAAIAAKPHSPLARARWVVTLGHNVDRATMRDVQTAGKRSGVEVVDFLPEMARHFLTAKLAISQCGYNTTVDLLRAGCTVVLCPYAGIKQNEQLHRAELLAARGLAVMVREDELTPATLNAGIERALVLPRHSLDINMAGASNTAILLKKFLAV
ncbi:MAG: glycosyltransferase [Pseudomonadota bacterium]